MSVFDLIKPMATETPLIVSSPHSGIEFPKLVAEQLLEKYVSHPEDTDWFVDQLYSFVPEIGGCLLKARYSRYVVDLNRDPARSNLYSDGRIETKIVPTTSFEGEPLYREDVPEEIEVKLRIEKYFQPFHLELQRLIAEKIQKFGVALVFDAHSIRRIVRAISRNPFPDLILGDADGKSADPRLTAQFLKLITSQDKFKVQHNDPFKGGFITRHYGNPKNGIQALQLEMSQDIYMAPGQKSFEPSRAKEIQSLLKNLLIKLSKSVVEI